jgi:hypothetical protein
MGCDPGSGSCVDGSDSGRQGQTGGDATATSTSGDTGAVPTPQACLEEQPQAANDQGAWRSVLQETAIGLPWLPSTQGGASIQQGGQQQLVTLEQLQLALCGLSHASVMGAPSAALLLALLLQRAGPGLRAEFLGGPGGTALLGAAQYWGYYYPCQSTGGHGAASFNFLEDHSIRDKITATHLLAVLDSSSDSPRTWRLVRCGTSLGLLLAWCYLQRRPNRAVVPEVAGGDTGTYALVTTPYHSQCVRETSVNAAGEC